MAVTGHGALQCFGAQAVAALVALGTFAAAATAAEAPLKGGDSPLDRPDFEWVSANRDPFEYRPLRKARGKGGDKGKGGLIKLITGGSKRGDGDGGKGDGGKNGEDASQTLLKFILKRAADAEEQLCLQKYSEAAKLATEALNRIEAEQDPDGKFIERLKRLRDTARRLDERAKIERRFSDLPISVEGIVWAPAKAVALINGKVKHAGQAVEGVTIAEIRRGEVIFVLEKGVRVRKRPLGAGAD